MMAPHTSSLAFSFLACTCALLGMAPHTPSLAFSFLACACALLGGCSAHAKSCFFFSGVCLCPVGNGSAHAKSCFFFSGVYLCPVGVAPHTPNLAFSFLACACSLRLRQQASRLTHTLGLRLDPCGQLCLPGNIQRRCR